MEVITKEELEMNEERFKKRVFNGEVFIHPTDTIYGLGCNALDSNAIKKVREIKKRKDTPFSIIAPSKEWIYENCEVNEEAKKWIEKLPGPYTLILKLKNKNAIAKEANNGLDSIGIRIPNHWISEFISKINIPIITTSVNVSGEGFMTNIDDLPDEIKEKTYFMIDEGIKEGEQSTIVHLDKEKTEIIER